MKTAIINARVKPELKESVESILGKLGITSTQAITMFYEQIRLNKGIPFSLKLPDKENAPIEPSKKNRRDQPLDVGVLAQQYFGTVGGIELTLPKRETYEPVSFD